MGKIKKILENELVGGTQTTDVYPVTSIKAVYDENNERLDSILGGLGNKIDTLKNAGYLYAGIATPATNPGTPNAKVFYIANGKGTYTNFGGLDVTEDEVVILYYDTKWHKVSTGIASQAKLSELESKCGILDTIDDEPTAGSDNLVKSGGVKREEYNINNKLLLLNSGTAQIDITNDLIKNNGYVNTNGVVSSSTEYFFTQPFFIKKGCTITWYVVADETAVLSTTQNASINIGDTINVVSTQQYYGTYTAEEDTYVVLSGAYSSLKNVTISDGISEYNVRKNNALHNNVGGQIIHYNAIPKNNSRFELYDYIPKGREYTIKYVDAYKIFAYFSDNTYALIRGDVSTDITALAEKDIVAFQVSYNSGAGVLTNVFNVTSVAPVPKDYSSEIAILDDKVETLNNDFFGEKIELFNAIPISGYNNLSSVIPSGTKYHIHFPQDKALYEYYEGGDSYATIRRSGSDDVDVIAGGNVNRIYVSSGQPLPSVKMEVTYKITKGALEEVEGLKGRTDELEEKINSVSVGTKLFIGSLYSDGEKRKMVSLCAVPFHGCTLTFTLPEGVSAGVISGVSNDYAADAGVTLSNGGTFTFDITHNYYRIYFKGASLETINNYLSNGDINVVFDAENNIVSEQQGCDSYIKSICYDFTSNYANNKMYSMPIFCHISDTHGDAMRMQRCLKYCEYLGGVDAVLHSGDAVAWNKNSKMTYVDDLTKDSSIVVLPCIGNHEAMLATEQDLYDDISYLMTKNNVVTDSNTEVPTYYYKDITDKKIRIIVLNQFFADGRHYTQDELNFFVSALLTTQNEYGVIVMAHSPEGRPTKDNNYSAFYRDVTVGEGYVQLVGNAKPIQDIVDAFISRVTLTKSYTQKYGNETETLTVNADFTNIDSSVEFIAHITGHEHEDCIGYNADTTNKQLMLNITCGVGIMGGSVELANDSDLGRDGKGQSQDAFNIYAIDRVNGTVRIARVGANINNQMKECKYMIIPYK